MQKQAATFSAKDLANLDSEIMTVLGGSSFSGYIIPFEPAVQARLCRMAVDGKGDPYSYFTVTTDIFQTTLGNPQLYESDTDEQGQRFIGSSFIFGGPGAGKSKPCESLEKNLILPLENKMGAAVRAKEVEPSAPKQLLMQSGHVWKLQDSVAKNNDTGSLMVAEYKDMKRALLEPGTGCTGTFLRLTADSVIRPKEYNRSKYGGITQCGFTFMGMGVPENVRDFLKTFGAGSGILRRVQFVYTSGADWKLFAKSNVGFDWSMLVEKLKVVYTSVFNADAQAKKTFKLVLEPNKELKKVIARNSKNMKDVLSKGENFDLQAFLALGSEHEKTMMEDKSEGPAAEILRQSKKLAEAFGSDEDLTTICDGLLFMLLNVVHLF